MRFILAPSSLIIENDPEDPSVLTVAIGDQSTSIPISLLERGVHFAAGEADAMIKHQERVDEATAKRLGITLEAYLRREGRA